MPRTIATAITVSRFSALLAAAFPLHAAGGSTGMVEPAGINMSTNEVLYVLDEAVQVTVQVQPPLDLNNLLRFNVYTPGGDTFRIAEFAINSDGRFVWTFDLSSSEAGQWTINARFSTKQVEATINVLETDVFDKVFMESAALFDVRGNEMMSGEGRVGVRMHVDRPDRGEWQDVEMTGYFRLLGSNDEITMIARHGNSYKDNGGCDALGYYAMLDAYGDAYFKKKLYHSNGGYSDMVGEVEDAVNNPRGEWIGVKFAAYNLGSNEVKMELWADEGDEGNDW